LSSYAKAMHRRWGNPADAIATRRAEDQKSMEILGASFRLLNYNDCIYRGASARGGWYYNSDADIFGQIHPTDSALITDIADSIFEVISDDPGVTIYAPLTVGHHVDHQLTQAAARQLQRQGYAVAFYEDYPYADPNYPPFGSDNPHGLQATLAAQQLDGLLPQIRRLSEADLKAKIESIRAYTSQLPILFDSDKTMIAQVRNYVLHVGKGKPAERIWVPV
jgi:LmbE family N-acetylglucosaminyl deacetylase